jgi:hypothetical protein
MIARRRFHQTVFLVAGLYNLGWGAFSVLDPLSQTTREPRPYGPQRQFRFWDQPVSIADITFPVFLH